MLGKGAGRSFHPGTSLGVSAQSAPIKAIVEPNSACVQVTLLAPAQTPLP